MNDWAGEANFSDRVADYGVTNVWGLVSSDDGFRPLRPKVLHIKEVTIINTFKLRRITLSFFKMRISTTKAERAEFGVLGVFGQ